MDSARRTDNWRRWGDADQVGALNLVTDDKRRRSAALVRRGTTFSLSRQIRVKDVTADEEALSRIRMGSHLEAVTEELRLDYHGQAITHLDALGHIWDDGRMWGDRLPDSAIRAHGLDWGGVQSWRAGLVTRGILIDICRHRGVDFVTADSPVTGAELRDIATAGGIVVEPGDALAVYCGRENWEAAGRPGESAPGLDPSCVEVLGDWDCSALLWDQNEVATDPDGPYRRPVHSVIWLFGMAVIDGAKLDELAQACARWGASEFLLVVAPLNIDGASGSPVNPLALL